ncbi:MAG: FHA domain-containing protein [Chloroflexi bacterium]|nr:FHA domain-containing protein [Chloroflexota bacterium]
MPVDVLVLLLRLSMVAVLYLFLVALVAMLRRDLVRQVEAPPEPEGAGTLVVLDPGPTPLRRGQTLPLRPTTSLGRDEQNVIVLADTFASARHAVLTWREGRWWLRDLQSTNGTYVNQQSVRGEAALEAGDVIGIGSVRLKLSP